MELSLKNWISLTNKKNWFIYENFYDTITLENRVLESYKKLGFVHNQVEIFASKAKEDPVIKSTINVALFPSYVHPTFSNGHFLNVFKVPQKKINGYAIVINGHSNLESLFKEEFKKSFRANILRFVKRFESCFNAHYKLFFGEISEKDYLFLMDTLHGMLTNRFHQRNDSNKVLKNWDQYLATTHALIMEKKASLFVIYHNDVPVHICLNHHYNNILFISVPSYDIDYAKFALGNISLYKLLEWAVGNNYQIMDLAYGDLEYKRRWSNLIYSFEHHIVHSKKNTLSAALAFIEVKKLAVKNYLKTKNIDVLLDKIKKRLRKSTPYQENYQYKFGTIEGFDPNDLQKTTVPMSSFDFLKKPINDFLFLQKEHIDDLRVFEITASKEYILSGKKSTQRLCLF